MSPCRDGGMRMKKYDVVVLVLGLTTLVPCTLLWGATVAKLSNKYMYVMVL